MIIKEESECFNLNCRCAVVTTEYTSSDLSMLNIWIIQNVL